ncbi:MAG: DUF3473 domain-containing protein [Nitrospiraceae bacterium]|nr:DUF3473 domain-containing protein [Nitrospiraceae bacterium]
MNAFGRPKTPSGVRNAMTIDVEDYYMVSAFSDVVRFDDWRKYESRVERNTRILLGLLAEHGVTATFFVLGWVAERFPSLIKDIHSDGHEIACHGYNHRLVYEMTPEEFREDIRRAKGVLEDIAGSDVIGYRAASYSILKRTLWALDILIEEGFLYDSSIFPIRHDRYGFPGAARFAHEIKGEKGTIKEFPPSTYRLLGQNIPVAGGGYLRLLPLSLTMGAIKSINLKENQSAVIYLHPWEVDIDQPRMNGRLMSRFRHYTNLKTTLPKLDELLKWFSFGPLCTFIQR